MPQPPKKILVVITKAETGGAQMFAYYLARGLAARGAQVTVGYGEEGILTSWLAEAGIPAVRLKNLRRTHNPFTNLFFSSELKTFLKRSPHEFVQFNSTNSLFGAKGAKAAGARTVFTIHGLSVLDDGYGANAFMKALYRMAFAFLLRSVDATVFVSKENLARGERLGLSRRGVTIYNGVGAPKFAGENAARAFFAKIINKDLSGAFVVGSIGRLSYQKNYQFLIGAFPRLLKEHPDAVALIVGDGPERAQCEALIEKLGLRERVFLCGEIPNAAAYLKAFDVFALTSRYEGLSISLIETLFADIPAVASSAAGNAEIIGAEWCYPAGDANVFIKKIAAARRAIAEKKFSVPAERKVLFSADRMCAAYWDLFSKLS